MGKKLKRRKTPKKIVGDVLKNTPDPYEMLDLPRKEEAHLLKGMTNKMIRFCEEYVKGHTAEQAYVLAGYKIRQRYQITVNATNLLQNPKVKRYIEWLEKRKRARNEATADKVIKELSTIAFANMKDFAIWRNGQLTVIDSDRLDNDRVGAISEIQITPNQYGNVVKIKLWSKLQALELLGKYLKMWSDKGVESEDEIRSKAEKIKSFVSDLMRSVPPPEPLEQAGGNTK